MWGASAASSAQGWDRSVSRSACGDTSPARRPKTATGRRNQTENWNRRDALAAGGRRASKEGGMPEADDRARFEQHKRGGPDPGQNDSGQDGWGRNYRVHQNAYRAMVCIACNRMHVRQLDQNEKCQQDEANYSRHLDNAGLSAAIVAQMWLNSCQRKILIRKCQELILCRCCLQIGSTPRFHSVLFEFARQLQQMAGIHRINSPFN